MSYPCTTRLLLLTIFVIAPLITGCGGSGGVSNIVNTNLPALQINAGNPSLQRLTSKSRTSKAISYLPAENTQLEFYSPEGTLLKTYLVQSIVTRC